MDGRWEQLAKGCRVLVTKEHSFNTDTLLLAHFSLPKKGELCADFGTGCGTIPLLWAARGQPKAVWGVEIQEAGARLAAQSVEESGLSGRITILQGDVRNIKALLGPEKLDLVACNPPYQQAGAGHVSPRAARAVARVGGTLSLEELAGAARYALRFGGRLCICLRVQRLAQALNTFSGAGLEPKRLRLVQLRTNRAPYLFLLECRKGGRPGLDAEPTLLLETPDGRATDEIIQIYGDYRTGAGAP